MTSGLLDASVVVDWHDPVVPGALPDRMAISAISAISTAELAAGLTARDRRWARLEVGSPSCHSRDLCVVLEGGGRSSPDTGDVSRLDRPKGRMARGWVNRSAAWPTYPTSTKMEA